MAVLEERHTTAKRRRKSSSWSFPREVRRMRMRPRRARRARAKRRLRESCVGESVSLAWHKMGWVGGRATRTSSVTIGILPVFWNRDCAVAISAGESRISTAGIVCRCFRITPTMRCAMFEKAKTTTSGHARYPPIYIPTHLHTYTCMHACIHISSPNLPSQNHLAQSLHAFEPRRAAPFSLAATMTDA